jgi:hypothetical protein
VAVDIAVAWLPPQNYKRPQSAKIVCRALVLDVQFRSLSILASLHAQGGDVRPESAAAMHVPIVGFKLVLKLN